MTPPILFVSTRIAASALAFATTFALVAAASTARAQPVNFSLGGITIGLGGLNLMPSAQQKSTGQSPGSNKSPRAKSSRATKEGKSPNVAQNAAASRKQESKNLSRRSEDAARKSSHPTGDRAGDNEVRDSGGFNRTDTRASRESTTPAQKAIQDTTRETTGVSPRAESATSRGVGPTGSELKADEFRRAIERCMQTYRSYDPMTMIYSDHNGDRQSCP